MKSIDPALLTVLILLLLVPTLAQAQDNDEGGSAKPRSVAHPDRRVSPADCPALKAIRRKGSIRVGLSNQSIPFGFIDAQNKWVGFDVDMATAVARHLGVNMDKIVVNNRTRMTFLMSGHADLVAAAMTHKRARAELIDFTHTYFQDGQKFLVRKGTYRDVQELANKKIGSLQGTTSIVNAKRRLPSAGIVGYDGLQSLFESLRAGRVSAITTDATLLLGLAAMNPGQYEIIGNFISSEPYAMGVPKGSCLREAVNQALNTIWKSGEYLTIYNKWFGPNSRHPFPLTVTWDANRGFPGGIP